MPDSLDCLIRISHVLGADPRLVQAGGGNTSVKDGDGSSMFIKASGTPMIDMSRDKGWVRVSLDKARSVFDRNDIRELPVAERESSILNLLHESVLEPRGVRPSVETPLHAILDQVVMHSHPVYANAVTCSPRGAEMVADLAEGEPAPPMWVPYTDPGMTLAVSMNERIGAYRAEYHAIPSAVFLENHGFFYSDSTTETCIAGHERWMTKIADYLGDPADSSCPNRFDNNVRDVVGTALQKVWKDSGNESPMVRFCDSDLLAFGALPENTELFRGALSPDHIVYTGPCALVFDSIPDPDNALSAIQAYRSEHGIPPKLVVVAGQGICVAGKNASAVDAAEAMATAAVQIYLLGGQKLKFMSAESVSFIMNWEAEHYRASLQK